MIYFFHGTDIDKARGKAHDLIDSLIKKKPDASFIKIDAEINREYDEETGLNLMKF